MNNKKITNLGKITNVNYGDYLLIVDSSVKSGEDAGSSGQTAKIKFSSLKESLASHPSVAGVKGIQGDDNIGPKGITGSPGPTGIKCYPGFVK